MSYHETFEAEQAQMQMFFCVIFACVFVVGAFCALIYGFAWLSTVEKENTAYYGAKHLEKEFRNHIKEFRNHTHVYSTGKPKLK